MTKPIHYLLLGMKRWIRTTSCSCFAYFNIPLLISFSLLSLVTLSLFGLTLSSYATASATSWPVFTLVREVSDNRLENEGFEEGPPDSAVHWQPYGLGYEIDLLGGRDGGRALMLDNPVGSDAHGAVQTINFDPPISGPIYFGGWSKAETVTNCPNGDYSLYLDVYTQDGPSHGHILAFDTCTHDWQFREGFIVLDSPIESINVHCLLRTSHSGTVWFDDLIVGEVSSAALLFDSIPVTASQPLSQPNGESFHLVTDDGLALNLAADGGAITAVTLGGTEVHDPNQASASGFFVYDVANMSEFIHVPGKLSQHGDTVIQNGSIVTLALDFQATYTPTADRIEVHAELANRRFLTESERALTLYFALPISATETWTWGDDIRTSRTIVGTGEFANFSDEHVGIGANGNLSEYPWASLTGPDGGLALGIPLDSPCAMRLAHNPATNQFYAAFDLGLSQHTAKFPNRGWVDFVIYRLDDDYRLGTGWDFRAAAQGYYERFPDSFIRRIPAKEEGIWVAFADLEPLTNVQDFGIGFHELGSLEQIPFDEEKDIHSFYYLVEPQTHWMPVEDSAVDPSEYNQVIPYLHGQYGWPNLLLNDRVEEGPPCSADNWEPYGLGYGIDPSGGRDGGRAVIVDSSVISDAYGALQSITLNQAVARPVHFSGWSKAENVTGEPNIDYSIYVDVYYTDDTWSYGHVLQFDTGTHDWQFRKGTITPTKTIHTVNVYCLLRTSHTGTVWFDGLNVHEVIQVPGQDPLPLLPNHLTNAGFEEAETDQAAFWDDFYIDTEYFTYTLDETGGRGGGQALKLANDGSTTTPQGGARQVVLVNQTVPQPLYFSGWSRVDGVPGNAESKYSMYLDIHYTEGDPTWGQVITFSTTTTDWQFRERVFIPDRPISSITVHCLFSDEYSGTAWFDDLHLQTLGRQDRPSEATLSSGLFSECGRYRYADYESDAFSWCAGRVGCALFDVNPDPDISDPDHPLNKAHLEWNPSERDMVSNTEGLDGVYFDSFLRDAIKMDYRIAHFPATDTPLTYQTGSRRVGVPQVFATTEFARWVEKDVHENLGKWMMANWILRELPWGADLFDVMGTETDWLPDCVYEGESDKVLSYRRTLAYQRPYLLLMNTDFDCLSPEVVERYFQTALFYGFYPSMFSLDGNGASYWENPDLYNRDRDLFGRYVPIIRRLNEAGWEPVTDAHTSAPDEVYIERFGTRTKLYFTLRNTTEMTRTVDVTWKNDGSNLSNGLRYALALLGKKRYPLDSSNGVSTVNITLGPGASEVLLVVRPTYLPIIFKGG